MELIAQRSYHLFHIIMQAPVLLAYSQEMKWEASRLAIHGAYKSDKFLPCVEDPQDILTFLDHHFDLVTGGRNHHVPIQDALRTLGLASGPATIEALEDFDLTKPSFVRGICCVFQDDKPLQLRQDTLLFLPLIGDGWFGAPDPIMEPNEMRDFCMDWASTVDSVEHTCDVQKPILAVLLGMINSSHWRPCVVMENWELLKYFTSIPNDSLPLGRCINNLEVTDTIRNMENLDVMISWLAILCWKYEELVREVQEQLETVVKENVRGDSRTYLDVCLSAVNSELKKAKDALQQYNLWPTDPAADDLRTKINNLQQVRVSLVALKGD